jgi:hypothetical protein
VLNRRRSTPVPAWVLLPGRSLTAIGISLVTMVVLLAVRPVRLRRSPADENDPRRRAHRRRRRRLWVPKIPFRLQTSHFGLSNQSFWHPTGMTTLAATDRRPLGPRLIRAEILKLVTRRGLMIASSLLTVDATVATLATLYVLHSTDRAHHKLIGGLQHFDDGMYSLTQLSTIVAVLIGATAGAGDLAGGILRNLVITGRPRWSLLAARIPGGLAVLLPITALAYAITAVLSQVAHGSQATPTTRLLIESGLWFQLYITAMFLLALGLVSLLGSRATTLGILAGLQLLITPVVQGLHNPGVGAEAVLGLALWRLAPHELLNDAPSGHLAIALAAAIAVLLAWMLLALGLGAWRTITRDA